MLIPRLTIRHTLLFFPLCLLALLAGCAKAPDSPAETTTLPRVVCTIAMIADVAREIAGDRAEVVALMGPGIDPHLYAPTRTDIQAILSADLVLYNGLHLEGKMTDLFERAATSGRTIVPIAEHIDPTLLLVPDEGGAGQHDPHLWMDPSIWVLTIDIVRDGLSDLDPTHADEFAARAETYRAQLDELHTYAQRVLESVPEDRRVLVTAHDAFSYFGRRYGFEVVVIQGISTESEAGIHDIERIVTLLVKRKIPSVFVESTVSERNIRALIEGATAQGHTVTIGGNLFSDAMGEPGTYEGTYLGMIVHNITIIARALGGNPPALGMSGKLSP